MKFSEFITLYEAYTSIYGVQAQPATPPATPPATQPATPPATPLATPPATPPATQPTAADLLSAINSLRIPNVQGQVQPPETIDEIVCRIGGIKVPQKGDKK